MRKLGNMKMPKMGAKVKTKGLKVKVGNAMKTGKSAMGFKKSC
jgi:hypothetical protein